MSFFSTPSLPDIPPAAAVAAPGPSDADVEKRRREEQIAERNQRGRRASIVTGGEGVTDEAPVRRARLFGE